MSSTTSTTANSRAPNASGTQACAACKYQRRKCTPECILAPFFPPDRHRQFLNAHRLFGVSNILKIIQKVNPIQRSEAMRSIIYEADARARDPTGGCYRIIQEITREIQSNAAELETILHYIDFYSDQATRATAAGISSHVSLPPPPVSPPTTTIQNPHMPSHGQSSSPSPPPLHLDNLSLYDQEQEQPFQNPNFIHSSHASSNESYNQRAPPSYGHDYEEEVKPHLIGMFDREPPLLGNANETYPSSSNSSAVIGEGTNMEDVQEHDLKGAASLFTLKNGNNSGV